MGRENEQKEDNNKQSKAKQSNKQLYSRAYILQYRQYTCIHKSMNRIPLVRFDAPWAHNMQLRTLARWPSEPNRAIHLHSHGQTDTRCDALPGIINTYLCDCIGRYA